LDCDVEDELGVLLVQRDVHGVEEIFLVGFQLLELLALEVIRGGLGGSCGSNVDCLSAEETLVGHKALLIGEEFGPFALTKGEGGLVVESEALLRGFFGLGEVGDFGKLGRDVFFVFGFEVAEVEGFGGVEHGDGLGLTITLAGLGLAEVARLDEVCEDVFDDGGQFLVFTYVVFVLAEELDGAVVGEETGSDVILGGLLGNGEVTEL
jgi:hypothetical protein